MLPMPGSLRPEGRARLLSRPFPERVDRGQCRASTPKTPPRSSWRRSPLAGGGGSVLCTDQFLRSYPSPARERGRDGQGLREHVPGRQHRPGQRDGPVVRPHGPECLRRVLDAAFTKPFGIMPFLRPAPACGGPLHPARPALPEWKAREFNFNTRFIALAGEINRKMPEFVREKAHRVLNQLGVAPAWAKLLILGVSYKRRPRRRPRVSRHRGHQAPARSRLGPRLPRPICARFLGARRRHGEHALDR